MMSQLQPAGQLGRLHVRLQPRPAFEAILPRNGELRIAKPQRSFKNRGVRGYSETRVEFADALRGAAIVCSMALEQIPGLVFEMVEVGFGRELFCRHDELPLVCPGPHVEG